MEHDFVVIPVPQKYATILTIAFLTGWDYIQSALATIA
jgi:hypothetical protein